MSEINELSRLKLRCRRGMKELDYVLDRYMMQHYPTADHSERTLFSELLDLQDPELFDALFKPEMTPDYFAVLADKIRQQRS